MNKGLIIALSIVGALLLVAGIAFMWLMGARNTFVTLEEKMNGQWSQIDVQLQRRNDLIPNLVETTKGYAKHERELFENIAEARAKLAGAQTREQQIEGSNMLSSALSRLLVVVERYPDLKANTNFMRLMDELAGTENRLAVERKRYNDFVVEYNTKRRMFPANLAASLFGFNEKPYFKAPEEAKAVPKVDFK